MYKYLYRPSLMKRRFLCPASAILEHNILDEPESDICKEGTMIHDALAKGVCPDFFTEQQKDMFNYCMQFKNDTFGLASDSNDKNVFIEKKMRLFDDDFAVIIDGTSDLIVCGDDKTVSIVDWKFGYKEVDDVIDNLQLACYAAMAMQTFEKDECICHIVQPRVKTKQPFKFTNLAGIIANIKSIINECETATLETVRYAKPEHMDDACQYCKARMTCEHRKNIIAESSKNMEVIIQEKKYSVAGMTPAELTSFYLEYKNKLKMMNKYMEEVEEKIVQVATESQDCDGIEVMDKLGNRYIDDQNLAIMLLQNQGISKETISDSMQINISKLEEAWIQSQKEKINPQTGKKMTKKELENQFKTLTHEIFKRDRKKVINAESVKKLLETRNSIPALEKSTVVLSVGKDLVK